MNAITPNPLLGVGWHAVGGGMAANCYTPQKYVKRWSWETYWLAQASWCWNDGNTPKPAERPPAPVAPAVKRPALSPGERRELGGLPARIEAFEREQAELTLKLADPAFYKREPDAFAGAKARLEELEREHAAAFARWEQLEARAAAAG